MTAPKGLDYPHKWPQPWRTLSAIAAGAVLAATFLAVRDNIRTQDLEARRYPDGRAYPPCYVQRPATGTCK